MPTSITPLPHEIALGGVYLPPLLIAATVGIVAAFAAARLLNRFRISRFFFYPPAVFLALTVIFTVSFGTYVIGI
jgi:hypothetical protein